MCIKLFDDNIINNNVNISIDIFTFTYREIVKYIINFYTKLYKKYNYNLSYINENDYIYYIKINNENLCKINFSKNIFNIDEIIYYIKKRENISYGFEIYHILKYIDNLYSKYHIHINNILVDNLYDNNIMLSYDIYYTGECISLELCEYFPKILIRTPNNDIYRNINYLYFTNINFNNFHDFINFIDRIFSNNNYENLKLIFNTQYVSVADIYLCNYNKYNCSYENEKIVKILSHYNINKTNLILKPKNAKSIIKKFNNILQ